MSMERFNRSIEKEDDNDDEMDSGVLHAYTS